MIEKVVLIKIAAMGDVAVACRALKEFASRHETNFELHWLIDKNLVPLAQALLKHPPLLDESLAVKFHPMNATRLFRGSAGEKAVESLEMFRAILKIKPQHVTLLHRDWRYKALVRPAFRGSLIGVSRHRRPELEAYERIFAKLAKNMRLTEKTFQRSLSTTNIESGKIGILVGGAQNQKLTFEEKRWPRMAELLGLLLKQTSSEILLFGGPDDVETAKLLLSKHPSPRIKDLTGKLALHELPGALATLDRFVSIDSGLAHIAATVMTAKHQRIVTLFGPTDPRVGRHAPQARPPPSSTTEPRPAHPAIPTTGISNPAVLTASTFNTA